MLIDFVRALRCLISKCGFNNLVFSAHRVAISTDVRYNMDILKMNLATSRHTVFALKLGCLLVCGDITQSILP